MATKKQLKNKAKKSNNVEPDGVYLLKLVLYSILGCLWIQVGDLVILPIGLLLGILFASHDHFQIDRKIEFAVLFIAAILSFISPIGFVMTIG